VPEPVKVGDIGRDVEDSDHATNSPATLADYDGRRAGSNAFAESMQIGIERQ
jgi:hypothetical protein